MKRLSVVFGCVLLIAAGFAVRGCNQSAPTTHVKQGQQDELRKLDRGEAMLKAAASQLSDLPAAVDTELRPPVVLLDSRKSADGKDVLAICTATPKAVDVFNVIKVPAGNGRFRSVGVQPGDIVKYYVKEDETVDIDSRNAGYSRQLAIDLVVAQVLDDNTLLIEIGLNQPVTPARKIEIWHYADDRLREIHQKLGLYEVYRRPAIGWEPAPDDGVLGQVMAWLNQWIRQSDPKTDWKRDELIDTVDPALLQDAQLSKLISPDALTARAFQSEDARHIQEAIWLRDISRWAHGEKFDDVSRATALFDWTIRNIQLEADNEAIPRRPWQALLLGRGTAEQRAWVFAQLCRQQGLDVVILSLPGPAQANKKVEGKSGRAKFWLPALVSEGEVYLFDTRLGLPIPGPAAKGVATLEQVRKDDTLLRNLDIDGEKYPISADSLRSVEIGLVADPFTLSRRASQIEANLAGDDRLVLAAKPSELAARLKSHQEGSTASLIPGGAIRIWDFPFQTIAEQLSLGKSDRHRDAIAFEPFAMRPGLWKGRTRHFQGRHEEALGDNLDRKSKETKKTSDGYLSKSVRPTAREIADSNSDDKRRVDTMAKLSAGYWVGLMSFDDGKFAVAQSWLSRPDLTAPGSPWLFGATYNLARALEALGKYDEAAALLEKDKSPQQHGNKLRAKMIKARVKPTKSAE